MLRYTFMPEKRSSKSSKFSYVAIGISAHSMSINKFLFFISGEEKKKAEEKQLWHCLRNVFHSHSVLSSVAVSLFPSPPLKTTTGDCSVTVFPSSASRCVNVLRRSNLNSRSKSVVWWKSKCHISQCQADDFVTSAVSACARWVTPCSLNMSRQGARIVLLMAIVWGYVWKITCKTYFCKRWWLAQY